VLDVVDTLVPPGGNHSQWPSFVSDDHTPYEVSMLFGGAEPEIRIMAEAIPRGPSPTLAGTIAMGREVCRGLERDFGVDLSRLDAISDLFLSDSVNGAFGLWLAACFDVRGRPSFKAYLNPMTGGVASSAKLVEEMLDRLGFAGVWATVTRAMPRGPELDELRFVSLDLGRGDKARVKIYGFHHEATPELLANVVSVTPRAERDRVLRFCKTVGGGSGILRAPRQPATCLAFVAGDALPRSGTVHVPVRAFAGDDASAHRRILLAMTEAGLDTAPYENAVEALSKRPLEAGSGFIAWAAIRTGETLPKVNVYFAPHALADDVVHAPTLPSLDLDSPEAVVRKYEESPITLHPFWQRMAREPIDLRPLTLLVLNIRESITRDFARRLARIVAVVDEDSIRSILCKQLNDELGNGDSARTHKILFETFADGLAPFAPPKWDDAFLQPGRELKLLQDELYLTRSAYEGVGATLVMEVLGKQADQFMGTQFRRTREALPEPILEWLTLHEALEVDHVDESFELARRIPAGSKARLAARGAREIFAACWSFLDGMYRLCYGG
jgi:DMATS type aromatic prenyltransferase